MQDLKQWAQAFQPAQKPWLLLGKGPSFQLLAKNDISPYWTCSLNHVVRELPVTLAHIIDIDVVADCADPIDRNAKYLALPYRPHVKCKSSPKTIHEFLAEMPILQKLEREGRLIWYNLSTTPPHGDSPVIQAKYFSAEAALNLLVACGVKTIRSLGVDGGASYSGAFQDLAGKTLLANGHESFDRQFEGMANTIRTTGVFYAPLHVEAPIRVFVGTDAAQMMGVKLLEYSIKKHTPMSVEVTPIDDRDIPVPQDPKQRSRTGFSFSRFHIPELCGYRGRAIYMDADMQVFQNLMELWNWPMEGADLLYADWFGSSGRNSASGAPGAPSLARDPLLSNPGFRDAASSASGRRPQFSVLLMDCANLKWDVRDIVKGLDEGRYTYEDLMYRCCVLSEDKKKSGLPPEWNSLERYQPGRTRLLHYTDMTTQPWVSKANRNGKLWYAALKEAVEEGFIRREELYGAVAQGNISPDLPNWIGLPKPEGHREMKKTWQPPHLRFAKNGVTGWRRWPILRGLRSQAKRWLGF